LSSTSRSTSTNPTATLRPSLLFATEAGFACIDAMVLRRHPAKETAEVPDDKLRDGEEGEAGSDDGEGEQQYRMIGSGFRGERGWEAETTKARAE
jgi:hypothetical protein